MKTTLKTVLASAVVGLALAQPAVAAPPTSPATLTFQVTLTVNKSCKISSASIADLAFGTQDAGATNVVDSGPTSFKVQCTKNTPAAITLTSANSFKMMNGTDAVAYSLFQNSTRTTAWDAASPLSIATTGAEQTFEVYGKVADTGQVQGAFSDTVTVNLTF